MGTAILCAEFMDEGENESVILGEEAAQVFRILRSAMALRNYPGAGKSLVDLLIQFLPVGNDNKCPVARHLPQDLLGKENHGDGFTASLRMPEHSETAFTAPDLP